jgi:hypothetical protein
MANDDDNSLNKYASNLMKFFITILILIIIVIFYFSSGALILFLCKLAQSNILPTNANCAPYTDSKPVIQPSPIVTNIFTTFTEPEMSMKLEIPYDINSGNKIIEIFKQYKENSSSNFLINYFISIIESLMEFNYSSINSIMNAMNSNISETAIVTIGPIISWFLYTIGIFINTFYFLILWFKNMSWFFKTNTNDSGNGKPEWEDVTLLSPVNFCIGIALVILFAILFFVGFPFVSMIPLIFFHKSLLSTLFYKGKMNGKEANAFTIIKETLKYYKVTIVSVISVFVILSSFANMGVIPGIISILTVALIYYGIISIDIFKPIPEKNLTPSVSYEQAIKKCPGKIETNKKSHSFLYSLISGVYNLFSGQKGGDMTKELIKIGNKL